MPQLASSTEMSAGVWVDEYADGGTDGINPGYYGAFLGKWVTSGQPLNTFLLGNGGYVPSGFQQAGESYAIL